MTVVPTGDIPVDPKQQYLFKDREAAIKQRPSPRLVGGVCAHPRQTDNRRDAVATLTGEV